MPTPSPQASLLYYIDGHGFGHATRSLAIFRALRRRRPRLPIRLRTSAPSFLFRGTGGDPIVVDAGAVDPGTIQPDPLTVDVEGSLAARRAFQEELPARVEAEIRRLAGERVGLVAGDIPPLAFEVAARLGVPSIALGNFSWDWIYEAYGEGRAGVAELIDGMRRSYGCADLLLRMPLHGDLTAFRRVEDIPHVVRRAGGDPDGLRRQLGIEGEDRPVVLISFGGMGSVAFGRGGGAADLGDFRFVLSGDGPASLPPDTLRLAVDHGLAHEDLVQACDAVISKPGYGTVAECIAAQTPLLYTSRDDFREYAVLVEGLRRTARARFLPREDLLGMRWRNHLEALLADRAPWPAVPTDGAEVAAERLLAAIDRGRV
jgi:L-arabinokinase